VIIHDCEQNSEAWYGLRAGLPTASEFPKIITGTGKASAQVSDYAAQLAAEMFAGRPLDRWEGNAATERGHEIEKIARANYEFERELTVDRPGFITNYGAGCSPDGLVGTDGIHEIKCQLAKNHVQTLAYYYKHRTCPPGYVPQVQGQLLICEREWNDLHFFHPDLPSVVIRIKRDEPYIAALRSGIKTVLAERDALVAMLRSAA
jgi:hypothetical protein